MKKFSKLVLTTTIVTFTMMSYADDATKNLPPKIDEIQKPEATVSIPDQAAEKTPFITGTFDITNNYMFRGVSQTNNNPAFQGGLTLSNAATGLYFLVWGSNVSLIDTQLNTATVELDTIAGITNKIGDNFSYDINIDRYNYPKSSGLAYNELLVNLAYYILTAQIGYSDNVYNVGASGTYYNLGINYPIPPQYFLKLEGVTLSGGVGHYSLPHNKGLSSYNDYNIQLSKEIGAYTLSLQWTDTDGRSVDPAPLRDSKIVGMIAANF